MPTADANELILANYQHLWDSLTIRHEWQREAINAAHKIKDGQGAYELLVKYFNPALPWYVVGLIHMMECSCDFDCHLHNGDSLRVRTTHEPKGRPFAQPIAGHSKPYQWQESARDALQMKGYDKMIIWDIPHILQRLERYNGLGYQKKGINTPYLFSGTNHYTKGKFVADGKFDANAVSKQVGAAAILKMLPLQ
jgi:lysozyme family protein